MFHGPQGGGVSLGASPGSSHRVPLVSRRWKHFSQEWGASKLDPDMESLETKYQAIGLDESSRLDSNLGQCGDIGLHALFEHPQRPKLHWDETLELDTTGGAYDSTIRNKKVDCMFIIDVRPGHPTATHTASEFRAEPQSVQGAQFEQYSQGRVGLGLTDQTQALDRKPVEAIRFGITEPLRRQAVEHFRQKARQCITSRMGANPQEGVHETRLLEKSHRRARIVFPIDLESVEYVQGSRKPAPTPTRTLCDRGQPPPVAGQKVHDSIRFTEIDATQQQGFAVDCRCR